MRVSTSCVIAACLAVAIGFIGGCGNQEMPKGGGASGRAAAGSYVENPDTGVKLINKLSSSHQRVYDWLHRPFEEATLVDGKEPDLSNPSQAALKAEWDKIVFVDVENDRRIEFEVEIETDAGTLRTRLQDEFAPDQARAFIMACRKGAFDGVPIRLVGDAIVADADKAKLPLAFKAKDHGFPCQLGFLGSLIDSDGRATPSFAILTHDEFEKDSNLAMFGGLADREGSIAVLKRIVAASKNKDAPIRVKQTRVSEAYKPLFRPQPDGIDLPEFTGDGQPKSVAYMQAIRKEMKMRKPIEIPQGREKAKTDSNSE